MNSFTFNGTDLSAYGLIVNKYPNLFQRTMESAQLKNKAKAIGTSRPKKTLEFNVTIAAADAATLQSHLDSIRGVLNLEDDAVLSMDKYTDRYWMASCPSMVPAEEGSCYWIGTIIFVANDPDAYDNSETTSNHTIDADPKTFNEVVGGTAETKPVYTLTADDTITAITITNATTGEEFEITVAMMATDVLVINTDTMVVTLNGTEVMTGVPVTSQYPKLLPGTNAFTVTGFHGAMVTVYPKRYC
jgi:phage-related protein